MPERKPDVYKRQALYDKFLRKGKFLYVHGADDNHNKAPFGDLMCDSFGSWTQILAEELRSEEHTSELQSQR